MAVISGGTTLINNGALDSAVATGKLKLLSTQTASSSSSITFTSGIDSTYDSYIFKYINIHPASVAQLQFNMSTDGGSNYNVTKTSAAWNPYHNESDSTPGYFYREAWDLAQSTSDQIMAQELGNGNDESASGFLQIFRPSSTTLVKHFIGTTGYYQTFGQTGAFQVYYAGYGNTTSAVNAIIFKMSSGNLDAGVIKMYGVE